VQVSAAKTHTTRDPRLSRREAKIAALVSEAWELARRDGLAAISLRDLAAAVGLRQPSLYVYFDSKLALYDALFADGYRQLLTYLDDRDYSGTPRDVLVEFTRDLITFASADAVRYQMLFQRPIPGFEPTTESFAFALEFYERATALAGAAGIRAQTDIDLFAAVINGLSHQQVANDPGGHRWADLADRAIDMLLASRPQPT